MTVIAYRDGIMAGDGRVAEVKTGHILDDSDVKIFRCGKCLLGVAGNADAAQILVDATLNGYNPGKIKAYGLKTDGKRIELFEGMNWFTVSNSYVAIGCADIIAIAAMDMGATAREAVRQACKRNAFCGGRIRTLEL